MDEPILTYRGTVYPWHCDPMGHMNVMWYVSKFDEATWQLLGRVGLTAARCRRDRMVERHSAFEDGVTEASSIGRDPLVLME